MKKNPGWRLELETIELVQQAREAMGVVGNADVIAAWAKQWKSSQGKVTVSSDPITGPVAMGGGNMSLPVGGKPVAVRVETPYQIERRESLERLKQELAKDEIAQVAAVEGVNPKEIILPFNVLVNEELHEVIEYKGRRVLQRIVDGGPPIMMKNLTPQETVIYWNDRVTANA